MSVVLRFQDCFQLVNQIGLCMDMSRNTLWCYSEDCIWEMTVHDEQRDVWRIFMNRDQFDTALQYCKVRVRV